MSQKGSLSENELVEQVQKYFDLKLDRDGLAKPSKDVVQEIYKRFLDQVNKNWMKPKYPGHEPTALAKTLYWMKVICKRFGFEFNMNDLIHPTKRRTTEILYIILYVRAMYDECLVIYQQHDSKKAREREENDEISREISKVQAEIEQYALRIGQSKNINQLRAEIEEHDQVLRVQKKECDDLEMEKAKVKERIKKKEEARARTRIEIEEAKKKIDEYKMREDYASKISSVKDQIDIAQNDLQQLKIQNDLKQVEEDRQIKMIEEEEKEFMDQIKEEIKDCQIKIKAYREERQRLKKASEDDINRTDEYIRVAKQDLEDLRKSYEATKIANEREIKSILREYKLDLNKLIGVENEVEASKNVTFIKSTNN